MAILLTVVLGAGAWYCYRYWIWPEYLDPVVRQERRAAEALEDMGATMDWESGHVHEVQFGFNREQALSWTAEDQKRAKPYLEQLPQLKVLSFESMPELTDEALVHLRTLTSLERIELFAAVRGPGLAHLDTLVNLKSLLLGLFIEDAGIDHLPALPKLEKLELVGCPLTDAAIPKLSRFAQLRTLSVSTGTSVTYSTTKITGHTLGELALPHLETLSLSYTAITDETLPNLRPLPSLKTLRLASTKIRGATLSHLSSLPNLEELDITETPVNDIGLEQLSTVTSLRKLYLGDTKITDQGMVHLASLVELRKLNLYNTKITDKGVAHLAGLGKLEWLGLTGPNVTDASVPSLIRMKSLRVLKLSPHSLSQGAQEELKKALPHLEM